MKEAVGESELEAKQEMGRRLRHFDHLQSGLIDVEGEVGGERFSGAADGISADVPADGQPEDRPVRIVGVRVGVGGIDVELEIFDS